MPGLNVRPVCALPMCVCSVCSVSTTEHPQWNREQREKLLMSSATAETQTRPANRPCACVSVSGCVCVCVRVCGCACAGGTDTHRASEQDQQWDVNQPQASAR